MPSNTTRIFLVRHGATVLTAEDRFAGATDVLLSDEGREQARRLGLRLSGESLAAVYASPLARTMETARLIGKPHGLIVQAREGLREISHGHWEGLTRAEVEAQFPHETASWNKDPYTFAPSQGETGLAVTARALPALLDIVRASRREGPRGLAQGHHPATSQLASGLRSPAVPRQPRPEPGRPEYRRFPR